MKRVLTLEIMMRNISQRGGGGNVTVKLAGLRQFIAHYWPSNAQADATVQAAMRKRSQASIDMNALADECMRAKNQALAYGVGSDIRSALESLGEKVAAL